MTYRYAIIDTRDRYPEAGIVGSVRSRHRTLRAAWARKTGLQPRHEPGSAVAINGPYIIVELEGDATPQVGDTLTRVQVVDQGGGTIATY